jgi:MFS family permease
MCIRDRIGTGPVFLVNAASYLAVIAGLLLMRAHDLVPSPVTPRGEGAIRAGLNYVRRRRDLVIGMVVVGIAGTIGFNFQVTNALMATKVFGVGAREFGLLSTAFAVGSLSGALLVARRGGRTRSRPKLRDVVVLALAFGTLEAATGLAPTYPSYFVMLIPTGLLAIAFATTANAFIQLGADPHVRGRVMALYTLVFMGGTPLGAPVIGWVAEQFGPRVSLVGAGVLVVALTGLTVVLLRPRTDADEVTTSGREAPESGGIGPRTAISG